MIAAAITLFATPAYAVLSGVAPTSDPTTGLPDYYADSTGLRLTACVDGTTACAGVTPGPFAADTTGTAEVFYNLAVSVITGPKVAGQKAALKATQTLTLQGGHDAGGQPITFQRIRSKVIDAAPNATYSVVEPFGTQTIATNATGTGTTTQDIGCPITANQPPCNFTLALATGFAGATGSVGPFIQWTGGAPAGYVGDAVTPHAITGGSAGTNTFQLTGPGLAGSGKVNVSATLTQSLYVVTGKIWDPMAPGPAPAPMPRPAPAPAPPGSAGLTDVSATIDATTALPDFYTDSSGLRLTACVDGSAACAGVTPGPFAADTTATAEVFYNLAVATITGPKLSGQKAALKAIQTLTLQGGHDASNQPITFQRIRTRIVGGASNSSYAVVEPFGTQTVSTNSTGTGTTTQDIGCAIGANLPPCDFTLALAKGFSGPTGSVGPFIRWDSGAPAGYVGDAVTPHSITGPSAGTNMFQITGPGLANGKPGTLSQPLYVVTGKIAP